MPYTTRSGNIQQSRSIGHVPIIENEFVKDRLRSFRVFSPQVNVEIESTLLMAPDAVGVPGTPIRWVMSFDGSPQEVAVREEYPSTRLGYVQVAGVLVHLEEMLRESSAHLVDPTVIRRTTQEALHSMVLPGSNVCRPDMTTVRDSWRAEVFEIFRDYTVEDVPLLQAFRGLVEHSDKRTPSGGVRLARCSATEDCQARDIDVPFTGVACPSCKVTLFPTDALRIHEEVSEEHSNATPLGRLMTVVEHITMTAYLDFLLKRQPRVLGVVGFVLDGPLALFGPQAWLHTAIQSFVGSLYDALATQKLRFPVIVGIEKTGQFAEHAAAIGRGLPERTLMMLPDDYIYKRILTFRPGGGAAFGRDTYYGQKFFYKTAHGQLLTITIPKAVTADAGCYKPERYPVLPDTLGLLDRIGTTLYENAVIPAALAHAYASIPLRAGSKVLTLLSRELLGSGSTR